MKAFKTLEDVIENQRILVVDDDPSVLTLWQFFLDRVSDKLAIDFAASFQEAEDKIKAMIELKTPYDLVVADVQLTDHQTGIDLWNKYKPLGSQYLFSTALKYPDFIKLHPDLVTFPYIQKPINANIVKRVVLPILQNQTDSAL